MRKVKIDGWGSSASDRKKILTKFFGELPMQEARANLIIQPNEQDVAIAGTDAYNCALSQCCQRMYGSQSAIFAASVAYVDMLNEKGDRVIMRFILSKDARRVIRDNDARRQVKPRAILLLAPSKGDTIKYRREHSRKRRQSAAYATKDRARRNATRARPAKRRAPVYLARDASIRSAAGIMYDVRA
jgi:hypothetical protein